MPDEELNEIQGIVRQDDFKLEPKSQVRLFLSNLVRWAFSALFARSGNKLVALKCDQYGGLNVNPRSEWDFYDGVNVSCTTGSDNILVNMRDTWKRVTIFCLDNPLGLTITESGGVLNILLGKDMGPLVIEGRISTIVGQGVGGTSEVSCWVLERATGE